MVAVLLLPTCWQMTDLDSRSGLCLARPPSSEKESWSVDVLPGRCALPSAPPWISPPPPPSSYLLGASPEPHIVTPLLVLVVWYIQGSWLLSTGTEFCTTVFFFLNRLRLHHQRAIHMAQWAIITTENYHKSINPLEGQQPKEEKLKPRVAAHWL